MNIQLALFFITIFVTIALGFKLYTCLIGASLIYILLTPQLSMLVAMERMLNAANSFTLLAVPFFIFAGQIMNGGGVTDRIFGFARKMVGHRRGGLGYVNIVASMIFAGISGSALADVGGLGQVEIKAMREEGFDDDFIAGLTGASATVGPIIPPSIPFVVYGALANVSVGALFLAGMVPGIAISLILCIYVFVLAKRRNYPADPKSSWKERAISFKESFWALMFPVIILGGIWGGFFTPTEGAFVSIVYGTVVALFVYRDLKVREIPKMVHETVKAIAPAIAIVVGATLFGWVLNFERIDQLLLDFIFGITTNRILILLFVNIVLFALGMFVDVTAAIVITLPILGPLTYYVGVHPVHFGVILTLNLMIGLLTPPVGFSLYMLSSVMDVPFNKMVRAIWPWLIPLIVSLLLITYIPEIVMFLPRLMGFI